MWTRRQGFPSVLSLLPTALRYLHFRRTADAIVVVVDSDESTVHQPQHQDSADSSCRHCQLRALADRTLTRLPPIQGFPPIKTAIAVPTPSIEAWYLFGSDPRCSEAQWKMRQDAGISAVSEIRALKERVYGGYPASLDLMTSHAVQYAEGLKESIVQLEGFFPNSFGLLATELRTWIPPPTT
jgi:hypothetical protein